MNYTASVAVTGRFTASLLANAPLHLSEYKTGVKDALRESAKQRQAAYRKTFESHLSTVNKTAQRRLKRSKETGKWLTLTPNALMGQGFRRLSSGTTCVCIVDRFDTGGKYREVVVASDYLVVDCRGPKTLEP